jgi:NAD(P)-dependent dehydrogenase (short-subunit alcohol dehydrogenase family)
MDFSRRLQNKTALITGSSSGIGRGIAIRFAQEGASVAVNFNKSEKKAQQVADEVKALGGRVIVVKADVSNSTEVDAMVTRVVQEFGKLNILVNNAGIGIEKTLEETTQHQFERSIPVRQTVCSRDVETGGRYDNQYRIDRCVRS